MSFEKLFSPIKIRELELRNRVVMSAMGTHESAASEDGRMVTETDCLPCGPSQGRLWAEYH